MAEAGRFEAVARLSPGASLRPCATSTLPGAGATTVPGTELVVEADPGRLVPLAPGSRTRFPASGSEPLRVIGVPPMQLTVVPVVEAVRPDSSVSEWTDSIGDESPEVGLLRNAFPFSEFRARSRKTYVTSLDLTDEDDQWRLVVELEAARAAENGGGYW